MIYRFFNSLDSWWFALKKEAFERLWGAGSDIPTALNHLNDFINTNFHHGGWHRIGAFWIIINFWLNLAFVVIGVIILKRKLRK